jgi:tetratricopeptide (TPR) repeat protein
VLGELQGADDALLIAEECRQACGLQTARVEVEVLSLKASLRMDQRRLEEARDLMDQVLRLAQVEDRQSVGRLLQKKAKILKESGDIPGAIQAVQQSLMEVSREREPQLFAYARHNLLHLLTVAGRYQEAESLVPEVRELLQTAAEPLDRVRFQWTEGNLFQGLGRLSEAEERYRAVQQDFLELRKGLDAALVSFDLASLLWEQGRTEELKRLAAEVLTVFESREVHREAVASLLLFQKACAEERITGELIRQIAAELRRERRGNG